MSWQANDAVRRCSKSKGNARLLMVFLSNYAGAHGEDCRPSIATLVADTGLAERTIRNLLELLRKSGELIICYEAGPKRVNVYWFNLPEAGLKPPGAVLDRAKNGAIWPARKTRKGADSAPLRPEHTPTEGATTRTQRGKKGAGRGQALAPDPSGSPKDPPVKESGAPARVINRVLKPKEVEAAEVAGCPLWAQLETAHGGPAPAAKRGDWLAERRDLLERTKHDAGYWALLFPRLWATATLRWDEGMVTVPAVLRNAEDLEREGRRAMRETTRLTNGLADGSIMPSEVPPVADEQVAARRAELERRAAERTARLARLGTDEAAQAAWQRLVNAAPRLPHCYRRALLIPPQAKRGPIAVLFEDEADHRQSAALPGSRVEATKRLRSEYGRGQPRPPEVVFGAVGMVLAALDGGEKGEVADGGGGTGGGEAAATGA